MQIDARSFVRQHYLDFLGREPDVDGWNFWTNRVGQVGQVEVSRAFWMVAQPALFEARGNCLDNADFVAWCYGFYLQRKSGADQIAVKTEPGYHFWLNELNSNYGSPCSVRGVRHLISAFITSDDYKARFSQVNVEPERPVFPVYVEPQVLGEVVEVA